VYNVLFYSTLGTIRQSMVMKFRSLEPWYIVFTPQLEAYYPTDLADTCYL